MKVKLKLVFEALLGCKYFIKRTDLPAAFHWSRMIIEDLVKCKHIFFTSWSDGLKFSVSWLMLNSKPCLKWGTLNWNLIPRVRKFDSKFLFLMKVPTLSRGPPLGHNIDRCIRPWWNAVLFKIFKLSPVGLSFYSFWATLSSHKNYWELTVFYDDEKILCVYLSAETMTF